MICIFDKGHKAYFISCIRFHIQLPSTDIVPIDDYVRRYYTIKAMQDAGWYHTPNGWLCPDCSNFKRSIERRN